MRWKLGAEIIRLSISSNCFYGLFRCCCGCYGCGWRGSWLHGHWWLLITSVTFIAFVEFRLIYDPQTSVICHFIRVRRMTETVKNPVGFTDPWDIGVRNVYGKRSGSRAKGD